MTLPPVRRRFEIALLEPGKEPRIVPDFLDPMRPFLDELVMVRDQYPDATILVIEITDTKVWVHSAERTISSLKIERF